MEGVIRNVSNIIEATIDLAPQAPGSCAFLGIGGGFGVPYYAGEEALNVGALRAGLVKLHQTARDKLGCALSFESGRFISGPAGVLVCRVVDVKENHGSRFVLLDGGSNASGLFVGRNMGRCLPFELLRKGERIRGGPRSNLCGPLCTPMDRLATGVACDAREGDLIVWHLHGAYAASAGYARFLSFPPAREVMTDAA